MHLNCQISVTSSSYGQFESFHVKLSVPNQSNCKGVLSKRISRLRVQQQSGVKDCGLFALAYAIEICQGDDPCMASFKQGAMRSHLYKCLLKGVLETTRLVEEIDRSKTFSLVVKINCFCGMPDYFDENMVECEECRKWLHFQCAGVTDTSCQQSFVCLACVTD